MALQINRTELHAPAWCGRYVGVKWDPPKWTCWQVVRTVYGCEFDVSLPAFSGIEPDDIRLIEATIHQEHMDWRFVVSGDDWRAGERIHCVGDVAVFRDLGHDCHVGVMVANTLFLHVRNDDRGDTRITDLMSLEWTPRLSSIHRHRRLM